ncbi:Phosphoribosylformylglycinamidine synthase-like protein [Hapsidospora chrysogenum ATCC 11550]|uniref:Phosphoribosylformylglycinamidine synthase n=1 Tax=Hapsidospora chrysogenum (strain ATCC 11550 / CBS 779.69 / DSM 880 / IAM 14645 / JCM 23072 / IMI 49137) TaxID=857340 RepID=A0A086ST05_HAPC1|nr:Phosphoribosylformylglycinamidine synthase-like protein [Hapsidospora chrysogenum ATCC 11550]
MASLMLIGGSAFTSTQAEELRARINNQNPAPQVPVAGLRGVWVYYVHLKPSSSPNQAADLVRGKLTQWLDLPDQNTSSIPANSDNTTTYYISPRNVSPWSSKGTSITHVCGLRDHVERIERGKAITITFEEAFDGDSIQFKDALSDRMTESLSTAKPDLNVMFQEGQRYPLEIVDIFADGASPLDVLRDYNKKCGLALDESEMEYLVEVFRRQGRPPHDVELFMFAQVNSEHCRHKQFNAKWKIDGADMAHSLFEMIRNTHKRNPDFTVSAYSDNAAVLQGETANFWAPDYSTGTWKLTKEIVHVLVKVETHNHPTAISPFPGAATGSGGEIRDEGAVGRGSTPKAGLCGFWVSELLLPDHKAPWEVDLGRPSHFASSLDIMLEAPIGSARFNNEFGRPCLLGCFRTLLTDVGKEGSPEWRGYHKPIMIAGGVGTVRPQHAIKNPEDVQDGAHAIVLGGPGMLIGLGGGAASSNASAEETAELDFASVQRGNPEMQRRAQMVIDACVALGEQNPIAMIHDVGAGGLSNALPEIVKDAGFGGKFELRQVHTADGSMSPLQIWCNESQERYVLLVNKEGINRFVSICRRERCPFSDVGSVVAKTADGQSKLVLSDRDAPADSPDPINLPMSDLFPAGRRLERVVESRDLGLPAFDAAASLQSRCGAEASKGELITEAVKHVFRMPAVGSKSFLITIGDRTVGGLSVRDQMVGPWQTPVADCAVTATSFRIGSQERTGEVMAMGEKPPLALISPAASARMAVAESLLNLGAADFLGGMERIKLSANWMAAVNHPGEGAGLFQAVQALGMELCPKLQISIPVGKDSTSMKASWKDRETKEVKSVTAPMSVVITAVTVVEDVRNTWTPQLRRVEDVGETILMFVDLAQGKKAMGASALAQAFGQVGNDGPDVRSADLITDYFDALSQLHKSGVVLAYHDRSDGGLITTVAEMMFAGRCGVDMALDDLASTASASDMLDALFNEELGAVFQIRKGDEINFKRCFATCGPPPGLIKKFGVVVPKSRGQTLTIRYGARPVVTLDRAEMQQWWSTTSYAMQKERDNPACADAEFDTIADGGDPGISYKLTFNPGENIMPLTSALGSLVKRAPRVAVLREVGVNSHREMAFAFRAAGFEPVDVHMSDLVEGRSLHDFVGLAAGGGFSYGDVFGAGVGWAQSVLEHKHVRQEFQSFFNRADTFSLGVCNGCQMLTRLHELIPGAEDWPTFVDNASRQYEARFSMVRVEEEHTSSSAAERLEPSVFLYGMNGSALPIAVAHGEGRATFRSEASRRRLEAEGLAPIRFVDNRLRVAEPDAYPYNPNGSPGGIAGVRSRDGRVLALMPHPERTIMADVGSYVPPGEVDEWGEFGPWVRLFKSARRWVG